MGKKTGIDWCDATWNPCRGCTRVSEGCRFCYAEVMSARFSGEGQPYDGFAKNTDAGARWTGKVEIVPHMLTKPLHWKDPLLIFVNSMSDLFHESLTEEEILTVFDVMNKAHWHTYQVLTKRSERLLEMSPRLPWSPHIWMGVSVEDQEVGYRIDELRECDAHLKFLSLEPLIGPLSHIVNLIDVDWVIVGGESGTNPRPMKTEWALDILARCRDAAVPFFFKQNGGSGKDKGGNLLDGQIYHEMPTTPRERYDDVDGPDMADFAEAYYG